MKKLPFVWELNYNGIISHAIGTAHRTPDDFCTDIKKYLAEKERLLVESTNSPKETFFLLTQIIKSPHVISYEQLSHAQQKAFDRLFGTDARNEHPFLLYLRYQGKITDLLEKESHKPHNSIDEKIEKEACRNKLPIISLETCDEIVRSIEAMLAVEFLHVFPTILSNKDILEKEKEYLKKTMKAYINGDETFLKTNTSPSGVRETDFARHPDICENRNKTMVKRSLPYLTSPSLIAVGVAHFCFEPSMCTLYEEQGVRVTRI